MNKLNNTKTINYIYQQQNNNTALYIQTILRYPYLKKKMNYEINL